jgi:hypothetical protein
MKRYEVTRHLMDGDFFRNHPLYLCLLSVLSTWVYAFWDCMGECKAPIQSLLFSPSMIAYFLSD